MRVDDRHDASTTGIEGAPGRSGAIAPMFPISSRSLEAIGCGPAVRIAPVTRSEAMEMIQQLAGSQILMGARGDRPYDIESIVDAHEPEDDERGY